VRLRSVFFPLAVVRLLCRRRLYVSVLLGEEKSLKEEQRPSVLSTRQIPAPIGKTPPAQRLPAPRSSVRVPVPPPAASRQRHAPPPSRHPNDAAAAPLAAIRLCGPSRLRPPTPPDPVPAPGRGCKGKSWRAEGAQEAEAEAPERSHEDPARHRLAAAGRPRRGG